MKKVGQSKLSSKIILKCGHPFSSSIDFEVEPGVCDRGWNYNLESNVHGNHVISRHNSIEHFVLNHNKYKITLKEWLALTENERENNWCDVYGKWGVYRPKEEARQIIQGIIHAVYQLHSQGSVHGFLYHLENFAIQDSDLAIEGHRMKIKQVFLMHENLIQKNQSDNFFVSTNNNSQQDDRLAVSNVIFNQILGASTSPNWWFPGDLQDLHNRLREPLVSPYDWKLIANHPSLWHWKSRFNYIERVQSHYVNVDTNSTTFQLMKTGFSNISVLGWKKKILDNPLRNSPLKSVYTFKENSYGKEEEEKAEDLLRYFRNVRAHYREHVGRHSYDNKYLNPQFIELNITKVSELFLVKLYSMCQDNIEI